MRLTNSLTALVMCAAVASTSAYAQGGPNVTSSEDDAAASELVTIPSGSTSLSGIFESTPKNGQHAGVLILAGDATSFAAAKRLAKSLAAHGMVALTYQASGANKADAAAAAKALKLRGDVQAGNVGVIGIGAGASILESVAKSQEMRYAVAVTSSADAAHLGRPAAFGKLASRRVLVVQGSADAFSAKGERRTLSVERAARNVTLWLAPDDYVGGMTEASSSLTERIANWVAARGA